MQDSAPRPSLLFAWSAAIVIALSLGLVAVAIASFGVTWDPCSVLGGAILLPLPLAVAVQQYRALLHQRRSSAKTAAVLLFVVAGFALFAFATALGEFLVSGGPIPWLSLLLPMLIVGLGALLAGFLNLRWRRTLAEPESAPPPRSGLRSKRDVAAIAMGVASVAALSSYLISTTPPRCAVNVTRDEAPFGLPPEATEISFCQGYRGTIAFEFTIDEDSFVKWVNSGIGSYESQAAHVPLRPITDPITMRRYDDLMPEVEVPKRVTINEGLYYTWSKEDRGVYAAFDRETNRAYYYAHSY